MTPEPLKPMASLTLAKFSLNCVPLSSFSTFLLLLLRIYFFVRWGTPQCRATHANSALCTIRQVIARPVYLIC